MEFDWHSDLITLHTIAGSGYKSTQNVRRFMVAQCGAGFSFDRDFMGWIRSGAPKAMGEVVVEWRRRNPRRG